MALRFGFTVVVSLVALLVSSQLGEYASASSPRGGTAMASASDRGAAFVDGAARSKKHGLMLANANVREGARIRKRPDLRKALDRKTFVRRLMARSGRVPGVVVLQETYGSARAYVRALNRHPRAKRTGASYRVATRPKLKAGQRRCAGARGRHQRIQTTAILVNNRSVRNIKRRGTIRTWGHWRNRSGGSRNVRGCAHQPWAQLRLRNGGNVIVAGIHLSPVNAKLKTRAARRVADRLRRLQRKYSRPEVIAAGDFNLTRHPRTSGTRERVRGRVRVAHRAMRRSGLRDVNRIANPRGRGGVIGYRGRIDFAYTTARVRSATFDRCYLGYRSGRACLKRVQVFRGQRRFAACQRLADNGRTRSAACPRRSHRRYYSDHPMITAQLRW